MVLHSSITAGICLIFKWKKSYRMWYNAVILHRILQLLLKIDASLKPSKNMKEKEVHYLQKWTNWHLLLKTQTTSQYFIKYQKILIFVFVMQMITHLEAGINACSIKKDSRKRRAALCILPVTINCWGRWLLIVALIQIFAWENDPYYATLGQDL